MDLIFIYTLNSTEKQKQDSFRSERILKASILAHLIFSLGVAKHDSAHKKRGYPAQPNPDYWSTWDLTKNKPLWCKFLGKVNLEKQAE